MSNITMLLFWCVGILTKIFIPEYLFLFIWFSWFGAAVSLIIISLYIHMYINDKERFYSLDLGELSIISAAFAAIFWLYVGSLIGAVVSVLWICVIIHNIFVNSYNMGGK